jgi:hypothetical protein
MTSAQPGLSGSAEHEGEHARSSVKVQVRYASIRSCRIAEVVGARTVFEAAAIPPAGQFALFGNLAFDGTGMHDRTMRSQYLAGGAAVWAFAYTCGYAALIHGEDSAIAWWYVALIAGGVVALGGVAAGRWGRSGLVLGLAVLVVAWLLGAMTIGMLLIPAVVTAVVAIVLYSDGTVALTPRRAPRA